MNNQVYGFSKNEFLSDLEIEKLYEKKAEGTNDKSIQDKIFSALMFDPRKSDINFGSEANANKAEAIAHKLHEMTTDEFLTSDYPYKWLDELAGAHIYKVVNPKAITKAG
jgi:hypothetical protein